MKGMRDEEGHYIYKSNSHFHVADVSNIMQPGTGKEFKGGDCAFISLQ